MKRNLIRIKLNGKVLMSLKCSGEKDYIISFPKSSDKLNEGGYCKFHSTLHTENNRATLKVTDFGNEEKNFLNILEEANEEYFYITKNRDGTPKDIDINKGERYLMLENPKFIGNLITFDINNVHDEESGMHNFLGETKSRDEDFKKVIDIIPPKNLKDIKIKIDVCKNVICNPIVGYLQNGVKFEEAHIISDFLGKDKYTFIVLIAKNENSGEEEVV